MTEIREAYLYDHDGAHSPHAGRPMRGFCVEKKDLMSFPADIPGRVKM